MTFSIPWQLKYNTVNTEYTQHYNKYLFESDKLILLQRDESFILGITLDAVSKYQIVPLTLCIHE